MTTYIHKKITKILEYEKPNIVLVHINTSNKYVTALACFYLQITVRYLEVGLRTHNIYSLFLEDFIRHAVSMDAKLYPTETARQNLFNQSKEDENFYDTVNSAIDALRTTVRDNYSHLMLE